MTSEGDRRIEDNIEALLAEEHELQHPAATFGPPPANTGRR